VADGGAFGVLRGSQELAVFGCSFFSVRSSFFIFENEERRTNTEKRTMKARSDMHNFLFWVIALLTGLSAIAVVVSQNIVRAATWLLFTLGGTAGIFFLLGADFVGATQILVYVGGTLVLVVFGVMLTAQGPFVTMKTSAGEWAISGIVGLLLYAALALSALWAGQPVEPAPVDPRVSPYTAQLGLGFSGIGVGPVQGKTRSPAGSRTSYLLPFEIVSVHLLVVLIGAAYLARAKRRREALR
jgi:NADH:ubiquinone oxidoreductase subunit 6 (subunit J)